MPAALESDAAEQSVEPGVSALRPEGQDVAGTVGVDGTYPDVGSVADQRFHAATGDPEGQRIVPRRRSEQLGRRGVHVPAGSSPPRARISVIFRCGIGLPK